MKKEFSKDAKSTVIRLLASENLNVVHENIKTAAFDTSTRTVILPVYKNISENVYDLLMTHEVSHALNTPVDWVERLNKRKTKKVYVNIIEDARIEKMIQLKYPGLRWIYKKGYAELATDSKDIFGLARDDIQGRNFIDRINLHFKLGSVVDVNFTNEEHVYVRRIASAMTFDEVLDLSEEIYKYVAELNVEEEKAKDKKKSEEKSEKLEKGDSQEEDSQEEDSQEDDSEMDSDSEDGDDSGEDGDGDDSEMDSDSEEEGEDDSEEDKHSADSYDNMEEAINALSDTFENVKSYVIPDFKEKHLDSVVIDYKKVFAMFDERNFKYVASNDKTKNLFAFNKFQKNNKKVVSKLVTQFERYKAAQAFKREKVSRTGIVDTNRLHAYKFIEEIFKSNTVVKDGKSHGLIFVIDWSGSMVGILKQVICQTITMAMFCKKCNIPFEIYNFSDTDSSRWYTEHNDSNNTLNNFQKTLGHNEIIPNAFKMFNFLSSKMSLRDFNKGIYMMFTLGINKNNFLYRGPFILGCTPLNSAIIFSDLIVKKFMKENSVEKPVLIFLTDGSANDKFLDKDGTLVGVYSNSYFVKDKKTGYSVKVNVGSGDAVFFTENSTATYVKLLKIKNPTLTLINFHLIYDNYDNPVKTMKNRHNFDVKYNMDNCNGVKIKEASFYLSQKQKNEKQQMYEYKTPSWDKLYIFLDAKTLFSTKKVTVNAGDKESIKQQIADNTDRNRSSLFVNSFIDMIK